MTSGTDEDVWQDEGRPRARWVRPAVAAGILALAGVGVGLGISIGGGSSAANVGPEGVAIQQGPDLAAADSTVAGTPVDGLECTRTESEHEYHIHVHVAIFVNGKQERIPAGAGLTAPRSAEQTPKGLFVDTGNSNSSCQYWLHTHAEDGIVHVESPTKRDFTLGQFFDIWGQPLGPDQVGPARGTVVAFENGKQFVGSPRDIPLLKQAVIQLDVGDPIVAFKPLKFDVTGQCSVNCPVPPIS